MEDQGKSYRQSAQPEPPLLSVVVPCYNEEEVLPLTHARLVEVLGADPALALEFVYVDDGSQDGTAAILEQLARQDSRVRRVLLTRNFGHQAAVSAGLLRARGDAVVVMDADLQDPPEVALQMLAEWRRGHEVVYGVRRRRKESLLKRTLYSSFYRLYRLLADIDVPLDSGDFALLDRQVVEVINGLPEKNRFVRGLRSWAGFRQKGLDYERAARAAGRHKYSFPRLVGLALNGIFSFSTVPLTAIFLVGLLTATLSGIAAVVYFVARIRGIALFASGPAEAQGFTTLILAVLFFSGVQLISIGILGEYLGRIYQETKRRPAFVVRDENSTAHASAGAAERDEQR